MFTHWPITLETPAHKLNILNLDYMKIAKLHHGPHK